MQPSFLIYISTLFCHVNFTVIYQLLRGKYSDYFRDVFNQLQVLFLGYIFFYFDVFYEEF